MTAQERYIADQKASAHDIMVEIAESVCCNIEEPAGSGAGYGITEDGQDEIQAIIEVLLSNNVNSERNMNMKTQEIFAGVVTENDKIKDDNGQIESIRKRVIYSTTDLPAYDEDNAKVQLIIAASKIPAPKGIKDVAEVEVKVNRPFCG